MSREWQTKTQTKNDLISQLLANRGLFEAREIELFLNPAYEKLHDPFLFRDMPKAALRVVKAIEKKEKILIYSDYDADAITANALLFRLIEILSLGSAKAEGRLLTYIPDRFSEGYGLNMQAFEKIKSERADLVITVDCGTNSVAEAKFCKENGIDLIITDHHEITGEIPDAYALINPKNTSEKYPYSQLTGVAVAFKFACAILELGRQEKLPAALNLPRGFEKWFLDLVAIGTVADCHSLLGENRILVKYGLEVLAKTKWPGLKAMLELSGTSQKELDTYVLGFIIAPRINAAGRIEHARTAFDLLVTDSYGSALSLAKELETLNKRRQALTENVISEAREQLTLISERKILLAHGKDWPKGVVGLVAGKLTEEFGKPVLVLERGPEESTGSARSIGNFNIVDALKHSEDLLVRYGGHAQAAGFTLRSGLIDQFYQQLLKYADSEVSLADSKKIIEIEAELSPEQVSFEIFDILEKFQPFGADNLKPKFLLRSMKLLSLNPVGKDKQHLQLNLSGELRGVEKNFKAIAFNFAKTAASFSPGETVDVVCELLSDSWQGAKTLKLRIIDLRRSF